MTELIITRQVDELGRIPIPIELRRELALNPRETTKIFLSAPDETGIIKANFPHPTPNAVIQPDLGFLIIPKEYNLTLSTLDLWIENKKLKLKKVTPQCIFTGETTDLIKYKNIYISRQTIWELYELLFKLK